MSTLITEASITEKLGPLVAPIFIERRAQGLTQQQLANAAGLSRRAIVLIESGHSCSMDTLRLLYDALGLDVTVAPRKTPTLEDMQRENEEIFAASQRTLRQRVRPR